MRYLAGYVHLILGQTKPSTNNIAPTAKSDTSVMSRARLTVTLMGNVTSTVFNVPTGSITAMAMTSRPTRKQMLLAINNLVRPLWLCYADGNSWALFNSGWCLFNRLYVYDFSLCDHDSASLSSSNALFSELFVPI